MRSYIKFGSKYTSYVFYCRKSRLRYTNSSYSHEHAAVQCRLSLNLHFLSMNKGHLFPWHVFLNCDPDTTLWCPWLINLIINFILFSCYGVFFIFSVTTQLLCVWVFGFLQQFSVLKWPIHFSSLILNVPTNLLMVLCYFFLFMHELIKRATVINSQKRFLLFSLRTSFLFLQSHYIKLLIQLPQEWIYFTLNFKFGNLLAENKPQSIISID